MLKKRSIHLLSGCLLLLGCFLSAPLKAQPTISCPSVFAGNDTVLVGPGCANLTAVPVAGAQTTSYTVGQIPYNPYPYNVGTPILLNIDDTYSNLLPIGFDFCFYGFNYNQCVIGSNGILTFDAGVAGGFCPWAIGLAIPNALNPLNSIMAPWADIDPSVGGAIRYASYGTAPCRTFVVSYEDVPMFFNACNSRLVTSQIVLYETTNIIETYIESKPACTQWNNGRAIHGIHDATGTQATVVPGRNSPTQWTATNDAWRFVPAGAPNYTIQWFEVGNATPIGNTATINVCPTVCETDYYAEVTYTNCNSTTIVVTDTVNVSIGQQIIPNGAVTHVSCNGANDGSVTVNPSGGQAPYTYFWTPGGALTNSITNLGPGNYTVLITDNLGCDTTVTFTVTEPGPITANTVVVDVSCNGANDGSITANNVNGGLPPYQYSLNGGPFQVGNSFAGLGAGTYTVTVRDANNCTTVFNNLVINEPPAMNVTTNIVDASCNGAANGSITVTSVTGGTGPFQYSLNGGPFQAGNSFAGLTAGTYTLTVRDANNCTVVINNLVVNEPPATNVTTNIVDASCNGAADGSITATNVSGGTGPYQYSLNGGPFQAANSFAGLTAGTYTMAVQDANNCTVVINNLVVNEPAAITANATLTDVSCNGANDGQIDLINVTGGTGPYQYSLNGGSFQAGNSFTGLGPGTYTVTVRDANNCTLVLNNLVLNEPAAISAVDSTISATCQPGMDGEIWINNLSGGTGPYQYSLNGGPLQAANSFTGLNSGPYTVTVQDANGCTFVLNPVVPSPGNVTATATPTDASCNGAADGSITVNPTGGSAPFQYSLNGGPFQAGTTFAGLSAGAYTITVRDALGCTTTLNVNVGEPAAIAATPVIVDATCNGAADGSITATNVTGGTGPYQYSLNGGPFQAGNSFAGLTASTYALTVRDANNCTVVINNLVVNEPAAITANATLTDVSCNGANDGQIDLINVTGGTGPYQYSLNGGPFQAGNSFTGLGPGTYTVTVRDANNCTTVLNNLVLNEPAAISAVDSTISATCQPGMDGEIWINNVSGGTGPYQYSLNGGPLQAANSFTGLNSGPYTVTVQDANGCTFVLNPVVPSPGNVTAMDTTVNVSCNGGNDGEVHAFGSSANPPLQYSLNGGPFQASGSFTGLGAGLYTVVVRDGMGCTFTLNLQVSEPAPITGQAVTTDVSCNGAGDGGITVQNVSGGTPPYQYSLNGGAYQAGNSFTGLGPGSYLVMIRDANGCLDTLPFQTINEPAALSASDSTVTATCQPGLDGEIWILNTGGGTSPYQYSLNGGPLQAGNSFGGLNGGNYTVTVQDANGCTLVLNPVVPLPGNLTATDTTVHVSCPGGSDGEVQVFGVSPNPPLQYSLNGGPFQASGSFAGLSAGAYTVDVRDGLGCTLSLNLTVNEPAPLLASDSVLMVTCNGFANGQIHIHSVSGGTGPYQYSLGGGPFQSSASFTGLAPGNYNYQVRDANGCLLSSPGITVSEPSPILISGAVSDVTCNGGSDGVWTMSGLSGGTGPYQTSIDSLIWSPGTSFGNLSAGNYTIWVQDSSGCLASLNTAINEPPALSLSATAHPATCSNADGSAYVTVSGGSPGYTYLWSNGAVTDTVNGVVAGSYSVTITDANGCQDSVPVTIPELGAPTVSITGSGDVSCAGGSDGFALASASGGTGGYSFQWNTNPPVQSDSLTGIPGGTYSVLVTDSAGCTASASVTLQEPSAMEIALLRTDPTCFGYDDGTVEAQVSGGTPVYDYLWSTNPAQTASTANLLTAGSYSVTITDANGCQDSASAVLADPPQVLAAFASNPAMPAQIELQNAQVSFVNQSQNAGSFHWDFGDGNTSSARDPLHTYQDAGDFCVSLVASDSLGCADTAEVCNYLIVITQFVIPNTFTPNGDGRNDLFEILGLSQFPNNRLQVFNRWGNLIYEKAQYLNSWDGSNWKTGDPLPDGAYFYIFFTGNTDPETGEEEQMMGDVVIFR